MDPAINLYAPALIALVTIIGATVAVCIGHIDAATYSAIVAGLAGVGAGAGVHARGVQQGGNGG